MNAGEGKSINKASKRKTATREGPKQGLKSVDFSRLFGGLSHSKTVGRGLKSYCPCQKSKSKDLDFFICAARHNIVCPSGQHHLSVSSTSLPTRAAQMNEVALRANDVLRNDVGLRPRMLRFAQTFSYSHLNAQIGHQFPICSVLFATFPFTTSSKEHQTITPKI